MSHITVFYGFYGSGKSEIAVNYALKLAREGKAVTVVDLDAVTPYFRVRDVRDRLLAEGVQVLAPRETLRYADLPVLPEGVRRVLQQRSGEVVVDLGGDPAGARVLGGLADALSPDARGLFVVNFSRPFTRTVEGAEEAIARIAASSDLAPSGLVANTHMCDETTEDHIVLGVGLARELGNRVGVPVVFCAAPAGLEAREDAIARRTGGLPILWLERFLKKPWEAEDF